MLSYPYTWVPAVVVVGTLVVLTNAYLALIALVIVVPVVVVALAAAVLAMPYLLVRTVSRRWHDRRSPSPATAGLVSAERDDT